MDDELNEFYKEVQRAKEKGMMGGMAHALKAFNLLIAILFNIDERLKGLEAKSLKGNNGGSDD